MRFLFAALAAFLILRLAAARCFALAIRVAPSFDAKARYELVPGRGQRGTDMGKR